MDRLVGPALLLALALLLVGLFLPAITVRSLIFSREYSLFESIVAFFDSGDYFLFAITFLFTILFPVAKIVTCLFLWFGAERRTYGAQRLAHWLAVLSKWSMLDVFVIALMVLLADGRLLTSADIHAGILAFTAAVLLSGAAARRLTSVSGKSR